MNKSIFFSDLNVMIDDFSKMVNDIKTVIAANKSQKNAIFYLQMALLIHYLAQKHQVSFDEMRKILQNNFHYTRLVFLQDFEKFNIVFYSNEYKPMLNPTKDEYHFIDSVEMLFEHLEHLPKQ